MAAAVADAGTRRFRRGLAQLVVGEVYTAGPSGLTVDELHRRMPGTDRGTLARRFTDARQAGLIEDSGRRRHTRRGCAAIVWVAAESPHGSPVARVAPVGAER
jgi:hypothetical protein